MTDAPSDDFVRSSLLVHADVAATFRLFTEQTDAWWKRGPRFRIAGTNRGVLHLEPRLNGRLFESFDSGGVMRVVRTGRVRAWEPPTLIAFAWRAGQCAPHELTDVEVTFEPSGTATLVTVTNRGWKALGSDPPALRALEPISSFWDELLHSLDELALRSTP
jgi:uncharacterized protein YndB with AHSA1/START domain